MDLVGLLLPERCAGCGAEDELLCVRCRASVRQLGPPLCERCGAPVAWPVRRCRECAGRRLAFAWARSAVAYEGPAVGLVTAWKDGGRRRLASVAADLLVEAVARPLVAAVTFVPAASSRGAWRGHNPAQTLAHELGRRWELPVASLLLRRGTGRAQRGLPLAGRLRNVRGAFAATGRMPAAVALVDDVYTSGATAHAAAGALRRAGCEHVVVITFARALHGR